MRRRQFLAVGAVATSGVAGCTGALGSETDDSDPKAVAENFVQALADGDVETANELLHSESPVGELSEDEEAREAEPDLTIEGTEVLERTDDRAVVRVSFTVPDESNPEGSDEPEEPAFELRTEDGEWKIWDSASDGPDESEMPRAGATVDLDREENAATVVFVANQSADYLTVAAEADDGDWADEKRLEEVGESVVFELEDGGTYTVAVTAHGDERSVVIQETSFEL